jgi:CTP:molybdopterin cytidylyltransferase MocA
MTAAVVLAAGASRRLGRPKQTVVLGGEMLVERAVRVAVEAGLRPVLVVVRPGAEFGEAVAALGAVVVENELADEGMAASIRCGVGAVVGVDGVVVMTCDQVAVTAEHLRLLCEKAGRRTGSAYAGRVGIPAYFPAADFGELLRLEGDTGARELLRSAAAVGCEGLALDVDTEDDLQRARGVVDLPPSPTNVA